MKKHFYYNIGCAIAVAGCCMALSGCVNEFERAFGKGKRIGVNVNVDASTRGSLITTDNIEKFAMDAILQQESSVGSAHLKYISGAVVTKSASPSTWTTDKDYFWVSDVNMHFWSYAPVSGNGSLDITSESSETSGNQIAFNYSVAADPSDQDDLIFAYNNEVRRFDDNRENVVNGGSTLVSGKASDNTTDIQNSNEINLHFYHALSEVSFAVSIDDGTFSDDLKIESITLENIAGAGSCVFTAESGIDGFAWSPSTATDDYADYTISNLGTNKFTDITGTGDVNWQTGTFGSPSKEIFTTKNLLFLIPQDHTPSSTQGLKPAFLTVKFRRISTGNVEDVKVQLNNDKDNWVAGRYYKYKIQAKDVAQMILLDYTLSVSDWVDGSGDLSF